MTEPQTITPERQVAAAQIGSVFNSLHEYLNTLQHKNDDGQRLTSVPMEHARKAIEEASFWAIKHVLMYGIPTPPKAANDTPSEGAEAAQTDATADNSNTPTGADAQPPTTPAEAT
jgi:hypothetical protein